MCCTILCATMFFKKNSEILRSLTYNWITAFPKFTLFSPCTIQLQQPLKLGVIVPYTGRDWHESTKDHLFIRKKHPKVLADTFYEE